MCTYFARFFLLDGVMCFNMLYFRYHSRWDGEYVWEDIFNNLKSKRVFSLDSFNVCMSTLVFDSKTWNDINICNLQSITKWDNSGADPTTIFVYGIGSVHIRTTHLNLKYGCKILWCTLIGSLNFLSQESSLCTWMPCL